MCRALLNFRVKFVEILKPGTTAMSGSRGPRSACGLLVPTTREIRRSAAPRTLRRSWCPGMTYSLAKVPMLRLFRRPFSMWRAGWLAPPSESFFRRKSVCLLLKLSEPFDNAASASRQCTVPPNLQTAVIQNSHKSNAPPASNQICM